jgi:hypothetical protein
MSFSSRVQPRIFEFVLQQTCRCCDYQAGTDHYPHLTRWKMLPMIWKLFEAKFAQQVPFLFCPPLRINVSSVAATKQYSDNIAFGILHKLSNFKQASIVVQYKDAKTSVYWSRHCLQSSVIFLDRIELGFIMFKNKLCTQTWSISIYVAFLFIGVMRWNWNWQMWRHQTSKKCCLLLPPCFL